MTIRTGQKIHVLGIESSCDDTGVSIIDGHGKILSNCIDSQLRRHLQLGGVIPVLAKDYHLSNIDRVANEAFKKSNLKSVSQEVDTIAVTNRPGLQFSLKVGLTYARKLAQKYSKPLIPIHHMQAHSLMPLLQNKSIRFPFMTMLISGGHCLLAIASRYNKFDIIGTSRDESPGEFLDKIARRLKLRNLGPPFNHISGGASIEFLARRENADKFKYFGNIPMTTNFDCDFSYSGYRTILDELVSKIDSLWLSGNRQDLLTELSHLSASLQRAILIQMARRVQRAYLFYRMKWRYSNDIAFYCDNQTHHLGYELLKMDDEDNTIDLVISGGVAANDYLINGLKLACHEIEPKMKVYCPSKDLCSDNGLMIAWNGLLRYKDYMQNKSDFDCKPDDDSLVIDPVRMNALQEQASCPIGCDLREQVRQTNFHGLKLRHSEFKCRSS